MALDKLNKIIEDEVKNMDEVEQEKLRNKEK